MDFASDQHFLRLRSLTIRSLAAAFSLSDQKSGGNLAASKTATNGESAPVDHVTSIRNLVSQLEENAKLPSGLKPTEKNYIQGPYASRVFSDFREESVRFLVLLLKLVLKTQEVASGAEVDVEALVKEVGGHFEKMAGECCLRSEDVSDKNILMAELGQRFEAIYNVAEVMLHYLLEAFPRTLQGTRTISLLQRCVGCSFSSSI